MRKRLFFFFCYTSVHTSMQYKEHIYQKRKYQRQNPVNNKIQQDIDVTELLSDVSENSCDCALLNTVSYTL